MNGSDLATALREMSPRIRVLYVSGYPGAGVFGDSAFGPGSDFLAKPFTKQMLTQKLRDMLDAPSGPLYLVLGTWSLFKRALPAPEHFGDAFVQFDQLRCFG